MLGESPLVPEKANLQRKEETATFGNQLEELDFQIYTSKILINMERKNSYTKQTHKSMEQNRKPRN